MMFKSLLFGSALLLSGFRGFAQTTGNLPFLKISHLGAEGRPIIDLYLTTQVPAVNAAQGITGNYRLKSVCLLTEAEFAPLLQYAEAYTTKNKSDRPDTKFGTFEITLAPTPATTQKVVYTRSKSLAFLTGAVQLLQKQTTDADTNEALHRLDVTTRRLSTGAK